MSSVSTAKAVKVALNNAIDQIDEQMLMGVLARKEDVSGADLQNASNQIWRRVEQQANTFEGWDATGNYADIIDLTYPARLGTPQNSGTNPRADDLRDQRYLNDWTQTALKRLMSKQNSQIANLVKNTGSVFFDATVDGTTGNTGYDAIKTVDTIFSERQLATESGISIFLNDRDAQLISSDIANRSNMNGMPETAYKNGMIAYNTAGSNLYECSFIPTITGAASPSTTVATTVSQAPVANKTVAGEVVPVDYRISDDIAITDASGFDVGDWVEFTGVNALGLADKNPTGETMTFKIVEITSNNIKVYPKPIAADDGALDSAELAYANIDTQITSGTAIVRKNIDASKRGNAFWVNDSVEILNADSGVSSWGDLGGMKYETATLSSGTRVVMAYDGDIDTLSLKVRLFTWYGLTNRDPSRNGMFTIS